MALKLFRITLLFFAVLLFADDMVTAKTRVIRVAVLREKDHFTMAVNGRYDILDYISGKVIDKGGYLWPTLVSMDKGRTRVGNKVYDQKTIIIEPKRDAWASINDAHFRGDIVVINNGGTSFTLVNSIDLEQYIRGVLYHEISDKWPLEAIKAQAVATRTFALYSIEKFAARDYDVTNDVYSQVYGGKSAERDRTNLAVRRTKDQVLTYKGKIFPAFFHANSGGVTEDASELWDSDIPPLKGGVRSPFSINAPHYQWRKNFSLKDIQASLNGKGHPFGLIKDIQVVQRNKSGRVRKILLIGRDGRQEIFEGKVFRDILGPNVLRSNMYDVVMKGWYVDFDGHGWGHGVGMCQWGAYGMAKKRYNYRQILEFYYPSSELVKLNDAE